ncbi:hypothetical protein [Antrihabitans sp. YC2-6]|nr:hypothetical protein [Antrihabitans sp. YC2-6]MBJ8346292.1 hypothetical protein [Antrihabitans sp. YC2-6]
MDELNTRGGRRQQAFGRRMNDWLSATAPQLAVVGTIALTMFVSVVPMR